MQIQASSLKVKDRSSIPGISDGELITVQKPLQYLGGEKNEVLKEDKDIKIHFALAFPDTYEVGMSHTGYQILYDLLNRDPEVWAERVYTPLADMEEIIKRNNLTLRSLEAQRAIKDFHILGFSLQYELCGTNILSMLNLAGMKFLAKDRPDTDPLVIGGGPYSYHPEPLSPFFDCFLLGDAEEALIEILNIAKTIPYRSRKLFLEAIKHVEGLYIPALFEPTLDQSVDYPKIKEIAALDSEVKSVTRRLLPSLVGAPFPRRPIVPNIQTVHNRLSVEVMRGCVRGCRFCQAGYLYRPQRERSPEEIMDIIKESLPNTGYEEVSLLSLSTADYCSIVPLLKNLMDQYGEGDKLAISFPSTRVDALTPEVLEQVQRVRRTGFTLAPEGGSQRIRDVINKGVSDEQIIETCSNVFKMGWNGVKLYFMLGLPTETDEDLLGIIDIATRLRRLPEAQGKDITISVSTHVPKPHTPFQWAEQITPEETVRKQRLLADGLRRAKVTFRSHDPFSSFLEGVFARGGRELTPAIIKAYELGSRLDAWQDELKDEIWNQAFAECGIDPYQYLRARDLDEVLPWDHLNCGVTKDYFKKEYSRALKDKVTPDCLKTSCSICGACDYDAKRNVLFPRSEAEVSLPKHVVRHPQNGVEPVCRVRLQYKKDAMFRMIGHLELASIFQRASRRAEVPLAYSLGFHPQPKLSFGPPLQLGVSSNCEYVDGWFTAKVEPEYLVKALNSALPHGVTIEGANEISLKTGSIFEVLRSQTYRVSFKSEPQSFVKEFLEQNKDFDFIESLTIKRESKKGKSGKDFILKEHLKVNSLSEENLEFDLYYQHSIASPRASEVVDFLSGLSFGEYVMEKIGSRLE